MPIVRQYTPVTGVAELATRAGQQQQAVRRQDFQWQQDLMGLQANLQQRRDVLQNQFQQERDIQLNQFQQQRDLQLNQFQQQRDVRLNEFQQQRDIALNQFQQERDIVLNQFQQEFALLEEEITKRRDSLLNQFQQQRDLTLNEFQQQRDVRLQQHEIDLLEKQQKYNRAEARKNRDFLEDMAKLDFELNQEQQKFDLQLNLEQYKAQRQFDFNLDLEKQRNDFMLDAQLQQQRIMGDLAEQQMKAQQKERETEAAIKAIQENAYLSPEEQARAITTYQTKIKSTGQVGVSTKALQIASSTGQDPQFIQNMLSFAETLPNDLVPYMWDAVRNPERRQPFYNLYQQRMTEQYRPQQETPQQRRARGVPAPLSVSAEQTQYWDSLSYEQQAVERGRMSGIETLGRQQVTMDAQKDFQKALNDYISASEKLEEYAVKAYIGEALTGQESRVQRALELKRNRALNRMREINPVAAENIKAQVGSQPPTSQMTDAEKRAELKRRGWTDKQIDDALAGR